MQPVHPYTTLRPAAEELPGWQATQRVSSREEIVSQIGFGLLKLFVVTGLIIVTLLTTA